MADPDVVVRTIARLRSRLEGAGELGVDPTTASWPSLGKSVNRMTGGKFDHQEKDHRLLASELGALLGSRLVTETGGFWYRQRDAMGGLALGYPNCIFTVSPYRVVARALLGGGLSTVEESVRKIRAGLDKASKQDPAPKKLTPRDYERFYDAAFIEMLALDTDAATKAWGQTPPELAGRFEAALPRAPKLSDEGKRWVKDTLLKELAALDPGKALIDQAEDALRLVERIGSLVGARFGTGLMSEEGARNVALRLLAIGTPGEVEAWGKTEEDVQRNAGALAAYLRNAPLQPETPQVGLLGLFDETKVSAPHAKLAGMEQLRLVTVNPEALHLLLRKFDAKTSRAAIERYAEVAGEAAGQPLSLTDKETAVLEDAYKSIERIRATLAQAVQDKLSFCLRRATHFEGETATQLVGLREALKD